MFLCKQLSSLAHVLCLIWVITYREIQFQFQCISLLSITLCTCTCCFLGQCWLDTNLLHSICVYQRHHLCYMFRIVNSWNLQHQSDSYRTEFSPLLALRGTFEIVFTLLLTDCRKTLESNQFTLVGNVVISLVLSCHHLFRYQSANYLDISLAAKHQTNI